MSTKVLVRKLGREKAVGLAYKEHNEIHLDPRQSGKNYFNTSIHELLHIAYPNMSEKEVEKGANKITNSLWKQGYRKTVLK